MTVIGDRITREIPVASWVNRYNLTSIEEEFDVVLIFMALDVFTGSTLSVVQGNLLSYPCEMAFGIPRNS
mgnify:CR=1 FL=1